MKISHIAALAAVVFAVSACTSTPKVNVRQPGDRNMSCDEIQTEFDGLDNVQNEAEDNQGVNTANVAAVLLFWPAAVGNYMDADRAMDLVEQRRAVLMDLYEDKSCEG
jgi:hypothetical protein